jgi:transposase InsO family protein
MNKITCPSDDDPRERRALARFAAVQMVLQAVQRGLSLSQALHEAAQQPWEGRFYSAQTIIEWLYRFRRGQFAALYDQPRSDKGQKRALDPSAIEALLKLRQLHPQLTLPALEQELLRQGILQPGAYSMSTLQRRLAEAGMDRRSLRAGAALITGPTKAFELPLPNLLWMADAMNGPTLKQPDAASQRTFLFALIDDHSRLCVHGQFYPSERTECFLDCLRQAIQARGLPDKLYTDNGASFRSQHLQIVCANLGIKLIHARPYHSWSRGKIERFFLTVQNQFLAQLQFQPVADLLELNRQFWHWVETGYHQRPHSALQDQSPADRFAKAGIALRTVAKDVDVERLFLMRQERRVRKDATICLGARLWEVPAHLRGQVITVWFDPVRWTRVELWWRDRLLGQATACNKQLNSQLRSSNDYHRFDH